MLVEPLGRKDVTPTVLIIQAGKDTDAILGAAGLYLFGFTYLYVGIVNLAGLEPEGIPIGRARLTSSSTGNK